MSSTSAFNSFAALLMSSRSRASTWARARLRRYWVSTASMKAERDCFDPAMRSMPASTSFDSVIEVFSFILLLYHYPTDDFALHSRVAPVLMGKRGGTGVGSILHRRHRCGDCGGAQGPT